MPTASPTATAPPAPTTTSTPASAPAKTASAASQAPGPPQPPESHEKYADAFAELDQIDKGEKPSTPRETRSSKTSTRSTATESKESSTSRDSSTEGQSATDADKGLATGAETPPEGGQKPPEQPLGSKEPQSRAQLRDAYDTMKKRVRNELEPQIKQLQAKIQEYESNAPAVPKEFADKMAAVEKRNSELEQHMRFVDYSKSKEYQEQFWNPYVKQWQTSLRELKGLQMRLPQKDEVTGEAKYREITEQDIQYLATLDPAVRRQEVKQLFPDDAQEVMRHINEISRLFDASQDALSHARTNAESYSKQQALQQQQWQQQHASLWKSTNEAFAQKYPERFAPTDGDTEGNQWLDRGKALADLVFAPQDLTPEAIALLPKAFREVVQADRPFGDRERTMLYSIIRNKAMNHDRLEYRMHKLQAENAELKKSLEEYEKSTPDNVPAGSKTPKSEKGFITDANEELDAIDRKHAALGV